MYYSIIAILVSGLHLTSATNEEIAGVEAQELCKNPLVTSATKTPHGVICLIPKPVDPSVADFGERQQFVRSLPKLLKGEANDDILTKKIVPNFKAIRDQFLPQSNILSKRSIFSNIVFKFYEQFYKGFYKTIRTGRQNHAVAHTPVPQPLPQANPQENHQIPLHMPVVSPDHLTPEGQGMMQLPEAGPGGPPSLQLDPLTSFVPKANNFFAQDLQPEMSGVHHNIPMYNEGHDEVADNIPEIDETRLGSAQPDIPHYSYGSVRQLATYLQSIQEKINRQKHNSIKEEEQTESSDFVPIVNDYSGFTHDSSEDKEMVIPLYTDVRVRDNGESSQSRSSEEVRRPRKLVYEFHGYKRDIDCNGRFKPLKSDTEREQPIPARMPLEPGHIKSRQKRYIEFDYGNMQLRKLPIWFQDLDASATNEAIVEVQPRSLFKWDQPMIGWKPLVPPEVLRKDLFLKRNGDPMDNWDNEQVESQNNYQWVKADNDGSPVNTTELESQTLDAIKNLDLSKASVVVDRRKYGRDMNFAVNFKGKEKQTEHKPIVNEEEALPSANRYMSSAEKYKTTTEKPVDNQVVGDSVKAIEVENVGDEISKVKSLEEIAALPGAVIKPIDSKLTDILLKVLSHNQDFSQKRITNAYFLEFPKLPAYRPNVGQQQSQNFLYPESSFMQMPVQTSAPVQMPMPSVQTVQIPIETAMDKNYEVLYDKDIQLSDADYEYGEMVCANRVSGGVPDVRKGCRIYFQCTKYTIDTYVCPRGSLFDETKQFCMPSNQVFCGKYVTM